MSPPGKARLGKRKPKYGKLVTMTKTGRMSVKRQRLSRKKSTSLVHTKVDEETMECSSNQSSREQETETARKRMRIDPPSGPSCYNLFCRDLSSQENMKNLSAKERFPKYGQAWSALDDEERDQYSQKASSMSMSDLEKKKKWKRNLKKITQLIQYQQMLVPGTEGFFVLSQAPEDPHFGGTEAGLSFLYEKAIVEDFEKSAALGRSGCRMPYSNRAVRMEGLPNGLVLRRPSQYGTAQLRKIWESRDSLQVIIRD